LRHRSIASRRGVLALACAVAAAALGPAESAFAQRVRVALLPVLVHSSDSREYLQQGLADMLVARLGRDPRLAVIEVEDATAATTDPEAARAAGRSAGGAWVVFGAFTRFGEGASLDLQLARVDADEDDEEPEQVFAHAPSLGALIPMLGGVAERITARVLGGAAGAPPGADAATAAPAATAGGSGGEVAELRRRVEALERAVDQLGAQRMPDEPRGAPVVQPPGPRPAPE
jgi:TolB-like protein